MFGLRLLFLPAIAASMLGAILLQWHWAVGFNAQDGRWWGWLLQTAKVTGGLPDELLYPVYWTGISAFIVAAAITMIVNRIGTRTVRSEEHTSELQSLMRNSYAVFCLKKKN